MCNSAYAAPEIVNAAQASIIIPAQCAQDVWPLAVVAFEQLSGVTVAAAVGGALNIVKCARGEDCYPWELPEDQLPAAWVGCAARSVLEDCLQRPARARPTAAALAAQLAELADTHDAPAS